MNLSKRQTFQMGLVASITLHLALSAVFAYLTKSQEIPPPKIVKLGVSIGLDTTQAKPQTPIQDTVQNHLSQPTIEPELEKTQARQRKTDTTKTEPNAEQLSDSLPHKVDNKTAAPLEANNLSEAPEAPSITRGEITPASATKIKHHLPEERPLTKQRPMQDATASGTISTKPEPEHEHEHEPETLTNNTIDTNSPIDATNTTPPKFTLGSLNNPRPKYPQLARNRGWEGDVIIGVHVNSDGSIKHLEILKGAHYSPLNYAAWQTVKTQWTFIPAEREGEAVPAFIEVPISFRISDPGLR